MAVSLYLREPGSTNVTPKIRISEIIAEPSKAFAELNPSKKEISTLQEWHSRWWGELAEAKDLEPDTPSISTTPPVGLSPVSFESLGLCL